MNTIQTIVLIINFTVTVFAIITLFVAVILGHRMRMAKLDKDQADAEARIERFNREWKDSFKHKW